MSSEQLELLVSEMDNIVAITEMYPEHLQPTILTNLWKEVIAGHHNKSYSESVGQGRLQTKGVIRAAGDVTDEDWDYRRELITLSKSDNLDLKMLSHHEYAAVVAYVLKFHSPAEYDDSITVDHVPAAWRAVGRKLPTRNRGPLNKAAEKGLLDKVKGKRGCFSLSPIGENFVRDLLSRTEDN